VCARVCMCMYVWVGGCVMCNANVRTSLNAVNKLKPTVFMPPVRSRMHSACCPFCARQHSARTERRTLTPLPPPERDIPLALPALPPRSPSLLPSFPLPPSLSIYISYLSVSLSLARSLAHKETNTRIPGQRSSAGAAWRTCARSTASAAW
jgi:hypothetical protein